MTLIDILKEIFAATEEQSNAVAESMRKNGIYTTNEENLDIRYGKLKNEHEGVVKQLNEANTLITDMKKSTKGQEALQGKINDYEAQVAQLQAELHQAKVEAAIKVGLLSEKAVDVDYLTFKLNEKLRSESESLVLDDNGSIKGWAQKVDSLKTQFPAMFEAMGDAKDGYQVVKPNSLRKPEGIHDAPTAEAFRQMSYEKRVALKQQNPALYKQLSGK